MMAVQLRNLLSRLSKDAGTPSGRSPTLVWVRVEPPPGTSIGPLEGALLLTPFTAEVVAQDSRRASPGARVEVTVPVGVEESALAWVRGQFGWLADSGVEVDVHRPFDERGQRDATPAVQQGVVLHIRSKAVVAQLVNPRPRRP